MKKFYNLIFGFVLLFAISCNPANVDQAGNSNLSGEGLTLKESLPMIIAESPIDGSIVTTNIVTATFNKTMDSKTINSLTFIVTKNKEKIDGTVTYDNLTNTAIFTPLSSFVQGETYVAEITNDVLDLEGNTLVKGNFDNIWSFTISTEVIVPEIIAIYPIENEISVSVCTPIIVVFNVNDVDVHIKLTRTNCIPCIKSSVENCIECSTTCDVPGTLIQRGNAWIFIPFTNLIKNTKYTVLVTGTIEYTWNFITSDHCGCY